MSNHADAYVSGNMGKFVKIEGKRIEYSLAVNKWNYKEEKEETMWIPCKQWAKTEETAQKLGNVLTPGTMLMVRGDINIWKDKEDKPRFELIVQKFDIGKYGQPKENNQQIRQVHPVPQSQPVSKQAVVQKQSPQSHQDDIPF